MERVRQLVQCDSTMYAVGRFSSIRRNSVTYARNNAFSFSTAPGSSLGAVTSWNPNVNGQVNSVALSSDCSTAYLGGSFSSINGTAVNNIAAVSTSTGAVIPTFAHSANGAVNTLARAGSHLLVGGSFSSINGSTKRYLVSLNPTTGFDDGFVNLSISGNYQYTDDGGQQSKGNGTHVFNSELSPDGTRLLVMGVFTSVGGQAAPPDRHAQPRHTDRNGQPLVLPGLRPQLPYRRALLPAGRGVGSRHVGGVRGHHRIQGSQRNRLPDLRPAR